MQVTHVAESDSHVVLGGGQTRAFQVKASAAAFRIMSDSLYRDKERAAVREIVCNAIDAHIVAGKEALPVRITLTDDELTVEDRGLGIPDEKIADIYCTLFSSTKEHQDNQTGGFGLGSKAPFAISDHFTVKSMHAGVMTLYAMHIGDPSTNGTPGAKPMMQAPCGDQVGLTVSVPLAGKTMRDKIERALNQVVREGGMNVELNGKLLDAPDYTALKREGFGLSPQSRHGVMRIQVLYANVLYPLDHNEVLTPYIEKLHEFTDTGYSILLYAPPSSVSVTPSRESLSYTDITVGTLKGILSTLVGQLQSRARFHLKHQMRLAFAGTKRDAIPERVNIPRYDAGTIAGVEAIAVRWAKRKIDGHGYSNRDIAKTMMTMPKMGRRRGLRLIASTKIGRLHSFETDRNEYRWRVIARIAASTDTMKMLFWRARGHDRILPVNKKPANLDTYYIRDRLRNAIPRVVISPNRELLRNDAGNGFFFIGKMKPAQAAAIEAKAKQFGFQVQTYKKPEPLVAKTKDQFGPPCPPRYHGITWTGEVDRDKPDYSGGPKLYACKSYRLDRPTFEQPAAFIGMRSTTIDSKPGYYRVNVPNAYLVRRLINTHIGRTVMAIGRNDLDKLLASNVRRLEEMVLDKLKERLKKNKPYEAFYAKIAIAASLDEDDRKRARRQNSASAKFADVAREMLVHNRRFAHAAVREPYRANADRDEAYTWWLIARTVFHERWAEGTHIDKAEGKVITALVEEYRVLAQPLEAIGFTEESLWGRTKHLDLFSAFNNLHFAQMSDEQRGDFLDFAEELGRRFDARQKKDVTDV